MNAIFQKLDQTEIDFIKKHLKDYHVLLASEDPNDLILALHDFTVDFIIEGNVNDEVREAEAIIDKMVYD